MTGERLWEWKPARRSTIGPTCLDCQTIHCATDVTAVGRFGSSGAIGYRVKSGETIYASREDAHEAACLERQAVVS